MGTIGVELSQRHKTGSVIDRRFAEHDDTISHEDKMLIRFQRTRQKQLVNEKRQVYNLNSDDDDDGDEVFLTHRGKKLEDIDYGVTPSMPRRAPMGDDADMSASEDSFDEARREGAAGPSKSDFGGMTLKARPNAELDADGDPNQDMFKTKQEVMADLIAKSKAFRYEKQKDRAERNEQLEALDEGFDELRELLGLDKSEVRAIRRQQKQQMDIAEDEDASDAGQDAEDSFEDVSSDSSDSEEHGSGEEEEEEKPKKSAAAMEVDDEFDEMVKRLSAPGIRKARPSDALLTEEHIAKAERERLWQLERQRLARMNAKPEEENGTSAAQSHIATAPKRASGGDDLDDDFSSQWLPKENSDESDQYDEEDEEDEEIDDDEEDGEDGFEGDDGSDDEFEGKPSKKVKFAEDEGAAGASGHDDQYETVAQLAPDAELPFALAMPKDYAAFSALISNQSPKRQATLIGRLRACHHISLSPANRSRLQSLLQFLFKRVVDVGLIWGKELSALSSTATAEAAADAPAPSKPKRKSKKSSKSKDDDEEEKEQYHAKPLTAEQAILNKLINALEILVRPIFEMCTQLPEFGVSAAKDTLLYLEQTLMKKLSAVSEDPSARLAPSFATICFVQVCGTVFSATDRRHAVMSPLIIHLLHALGTCRIHEISELQRSVMLANESLVITAPAKRFASEPFSLLFFVLRAFCIDNDVKVENNLFDSFSPLLYIQPGLLKVANKKQAKSTTILNKTTLPMLGGRVDKDDAQHDTALLQALHTTLCVLNSYLHNFAGDLSTVALYINARRLLSQLPDSLLPETTLKLRNAMVETCNRVEKSLGQIRMPLQQFVKVVEPLPTLTPDFDDSYFGEKMTQDKIAKETKRMKRKIKSEQKGAEKELRKDTKFIQQQKLKQRLEKQAERRQTSNANWAMLEQQQSEMNREANREANKKKRR